MQKYILILILVFSSVVNGFSQWTLDSLSDAKSNFDAVLFENKIYFIGGETDVYADSLITSKVEIYNCLNSSWELPDSINFPRSHAASVAGDSGIYVFGGRKWTQVMHQWIRDYVGTNYIDIFKNGVWHVDSTIIQGYVWGGHGLKVGSKIMFAGFVDSIQYLTSEFFASNKVYIFDEITGTWSVDTLSAPRTEMAVATDGTIAIFAGGINGLGHTSDVVDIYNSITGVWSTANLSVPRCYLAGAYANGKFYFAGGELEGLINYESDVIDIYDGSTWTTSNLPLPRAGLEADVVNDNIYFMGGGNYDLNFLPYPNTPNIYKTVEVLITATGTWKRADFNYPHLEFAHTTWGTKIFAAGGRYRAFIGGGRSEPNPNVEIFETTFIGLSDIEDDFYFNIYPNPSNGPVTILLALSDVEGLPENDAEVSITDMLGHELQKTKTTINKFDLKIDDPGIYFVYVKTKRGSSIRKILISK